MPAQQPTMRGALSASLLLHGGLLAVALFWLHPQAPDTPLDLESISVSIVTTDTASTETSPTESDATATTVAAGVHSEAVDTVPTPTPSEVRPDTVSPVESETPPVAPQALPPPAAQPAIPVSAPDPSTPVEVTATLSPPVAEILAAVGPVDAVDASQPPAKDGPPSPAKVASPTVDATPVAPIAPAEPVESAAAVATAAVAPTPVATTTPQPDPIPATPQPAKPQPKPAPQKPRPSPASSGSGGKSDADARAAAPATGGAGRLDAGGNASDSRYPGMVQAQLRRALRFPAGADRSSAEVHVQFTVASNGAAGGISVVQSSGSSILDQAAVDTVRRAAPFPAIPPDAGRSSWTFTMPLTFRR